MAVNKLTCSFLAEARMSSEVTRGIDGGKNPKHAYNLKSLIEWSFGTAAGQCDQVWDDRRTIAAGATENLDLQAGGETNWAGQTISFSKILGIMFRISSSTGGPLLIGGHATNALGTFFGDDTDKIRVRNLMILATKDSTAYAVAASDLLKIVNEDGSNQVIYDIVVVGND